MSNLDREKAKAVLRQRYIKRTTIDQALDYLEACVIPEPPQTIDRDALIAALKGWMPASMHGWTPGAADAVLALVRPVEGTS